MAQQILQFNQAQLQLLDMMSFVKTPEALSDLNKVISDYFVKKAEEEMEKMWNEGTVCCAQVGSSSISVVTQ